MWGDDSYNAQSLILVWGPMRLTRLVLAIFSLVWMGEAGAYLHPLPISISARDVPFQYYGKDMYILFVTQPDGSPKPIPFQIDERDPYGDFILEKGKNPNSQFSNGIFDRDDVMSFMGADVGPVQAPTKWPFAKPQVMYELLIKGKGAAQGQVGAVYVGIYYQRRPDISSLQYVSFDPGRGQVQTSRFIYHFHPKNYLVVNGVDILSKETRAAKRIISSSTFSVAADLGAILPTVTLDHTDIDSELDAYRIGPIRAIARVNFNLNFLVKIELGMYTEVSFFSNAINLPAIIDNPLGGDGFSLRRGSFFYYGFAANDNPSELSIETNMLPFTYGEVSETDQRRFSSDHYQLSGASKDFMLRLEFTPSQEMKKARSIPMFYKEDITALGMKKVASRTGNKLGEGQVNLAVGFDMSTLTTGIHDVAFNIFLENYQSKSLGEAFDSRWALAATKVAL